MKGAHVLQVAVILCGLSAWPATAQDKADGPADRVAALRARPGAVVLRELEGWNRTIPEGPSVAVLSEAPAVGKEGVTARVTMQCVVGTETAVKDCRAASAEPAGKGFEETSVKISPLLRVRSGREPGEPVSLTLAYRGVDAAPAEPHVMVDPDWAQVPTGDQLRRVYPRRALSAGVTGQARFRCTLTVAGLLTECTIVSENPPGLGFGDAALQVIDAFRAWPAMIDGEPFGGPTIEVPLVFRMR
jgi:TonB family protein